MATSTLARQWADFEHKILDPLDASQLQRREMRRAFYAGAQTLFALIMGGLTPGPEPQPIDLVNLSMLIAELDEFVVKVKQGIA
jgi:hypothetical protein